MDGRSAGPPPGGELAPAISGDRHRAVVVVDASRPAAQVPAPAVGSGTPVRRVRSAARRRRLLFDDPGLIGELSGCGRRVGGRSTSSTRAGGHVDAEGLAQLVEGGVSQVSPGRLGGASGIGFTGSPSFTGAQACHRTTSDRRRRTRPGGPRCAARIRSSSATRRAHGLDHGPHVGRAPPSAAWMKLACFSETHAVPIRNPRSPSGVDQPAGGDLARHRIDEHRPAVLAARLVLPPPSHDLGDLGLRRLAIADRERQPGVHHDDLVAAPAPTPGTAGRAARPATCVTPAAASSRSNTSTSTRQAAMSEPWPPAFIRTAPPIDPGTPTAHSKPVSAGRRRTAGQHRQRDRPAGATTTRRHRGPTDGSGIVIASAKPASEIGEPVEARRRRRACSSHGRRRAPARRSRRRRRRLACRSSIDPTSTNRAAAPTDLVGRHRRQRHVAAGTRRRVAQRASRAAVAIVAATIIDRSPRSPTAGDCRAVRRAPRRAARRCRRIPSRCRRRRTRASRARKAIRSSRRGSHTTRVVGMGVEHGVDDELAGDARDRLRARGVDVGEHDDDRRATKASAYVAPDLGHPVVPVRLEHGDHALPAVADCRGRRAARRRSRSAGGRSRRRTSRRAVVAADVEPARHAAELGEGVGGDRRLDAELERHRHRAGGVDARCGRRAAAGARAEHAVRRARRSNRYEPRSAPRRRRRAHVRRLADPVGDGVVHGAARRRARPGRRRTRTLGPGDLRQVVRRTSARSRRASRSGRGGRSRRWSGSCRAAASSRCVPSLSSASTTNHSPPRPVRPGAHVVHVAADHEARPPAGLGEDQHQHRRGRRLAVRAGHRHRAGTGADRRQHAGPATASGCRACAPRRAR